jgi:hypothetical protein
MKLNEWKLGLAAVGLVSLATGLQAQDKPQQAPLMTALSATTISGYVDTSAVWNPGTGNANPPPYALNSSSKADGFNLDQMDVKIAKPLDEGQWSAGYTFEVSYGPDAMLIDGGAYPIRQAFVALQAPIGNGLQLEIGRFDALLGYESSDSYKNANWTHSYAKSLEPTEDTGILASYQFNPSILAQVGVANTVSTAGFAGSTVNSRNLNGNGGATIESTKAITGLITLTAPDSWGFLKGSTLSGGANYGPGFGANQALTHAVDKVEAYVGTTVNTPIKDLTVGASYDSVDGAEGAASAASVAAGVPLAGYAMAVDGYATYKITDKLSISGRGEYAHGSAFVAPFGVPAVGADASDVKVLALTGTLQYDLWANVISRLEVRWDHSADGADHFGGTSTLADPVPGATKKNDVTIAANVIYKF